MSNTNNYPKEVIEIHKEFNTASERLLEEAKQLIEAAPKKLLEKVSLLEKLGFRQSEEVAKVKPIIEKQELTKELAELAKYYSFHYPNNKFISYEQVDAICNKWGLVCGDVSLYTGFVPQEKLEQIANFEFKKNEKDLFYFKCNDTGKVIVFKKSDFTELGAFCCIQNFQDFYIVDSRGRNIYTNPLLKENVLQNFLGKKTERGYLGAIAKDPKSLIKICAPLKDMDTKGMTLVGTRLVEFKDPIVLQPVKGGYLVLASWGDEASDENVVNEKFN